MGADLLAAESWYQLKQRATNKKEQTSNIGICPSGTSNLIDVPTTATLIRVTNVLSPYYLRVYEAEEYANRIDELGNRLMPLHSRGYSERDRTTVIPKLGDSVVVRASHDREIDLPAWLCRGVIGGACLFRKRFKVLLIDHGTCVELRRNDFTIVSKDAFPEPPLSRTVGLYDVLPMSIVRKSRKEKERRAVVSEEWTERAIELTKVLLSAGRQVFFDRLRTDESGREYGEIYIDIEGDVISLSRALVLNKHAVYLEDLRELVKSSSGENTRTYEESSGEDENGITFLVNAAFRSAKGNDRPTKRLTTGWITKDCPGREGENKVKKERQRVLIYGCLSCESLRSVYDARFPTEIHDAWNSLIGSKRPKKIQCYLWPAIKRGFDVVAVGPPMSGKTVGCVVAITAATAALKNVPKAGTPSALILCSSSTNVLNVHSLCTELLVNYENVNPVAAIYNKSDRSLAAELFNGCQILISTPTCLTRFLKRNKKLLNFEELRHLLLDDADVIFQKYRDSVSELLRKHPAIRRGISRTEEKLQIVMTAEHWTSAMKGVTYALTSCPYICIASFIEAAIFKSVRPKLYVTNSKNKKKTVLNLSREHKKSRSVIVCTGAQEAEELNKFFSDDHRQTVLLAHENLDLLGLQDIKKRWDASVAGSYPILICTDHVLPELAVTDAEHLIHYSIALDLKSPFNFRFSSLADNLQKETSCNCRVTILADENDDLQFLSVVRIMQRMNVILPQNTREFLERVTVTLEKRKAKMPICENLMSFGSCQNGHSCVFRHCILPKTDSPKTSIAINDTVKLVVTYVHSATHFSARIVSYLRAETRQEIELPSEEYLQCSMKMQEYYSCTDNRRSCETLKVGDICTLEDSISSFRRVQILFIEEDGKESALRSRHVDVRCIDSGILLRKLNAYRLLYIPEELRDLPTPILEVFLTGLAPYDNEVEWNQRSIDTVHEWFTENIDERSYVIGTVKLHLGNVLWLDSMEIRTKIAGCDETIGTSLKKELLEKGHAVSIKRHAHELYKLCKDGGFAEVNGYDVNALIAANT